MLPLTALLGAKSRDPVLAVVVALDSMLTSAIEPPVVLTAGCRESFHRGGYQIDLGPPSVATSRCWAPFKGGFFFVIFRRLEEINVFESEITNL